MSKVGLGWRPDIDGTFPKAVKAEEEFGFRQSLGFEVVSFVGRQGI